MQPERPRAPRGCSRQGLIKISGLCTGLLAAGAIAPAIGAPALAPLMPATPCAPIGYADFLERTAHAQYLCL